ncbi:MAG: hypothetical protein WC565_00485 [Parcubacteria group bacterium]
MEEELVNTSNMLEPEVVYSNQYSVETPLGLTFPFKVTELWETFVASLEIAEGAEAKAMAGISDGKTAVIAAMGNIFLNIVIRRSLS